MLSYSMLRAAVLCGLLIDATLAISQESSCDADVVTAASHAESLIQVKQQAQPQPKWKHESKPKAKGKGKKQHPHDDIGDGDGDFDGDGDLPSVDELDNNDNDDAAVINNNDNNELPEAPVKGTTTQLPKSDKSEVSGTTQSPDLSQGISAEEAVLEQAEKDRLAAEALAKKKMGEAKKAMDKLDETKVIAEKAVAAVAAARKLEQEDALNKLKVAEQALGTALEEKEAADKVARDKADRETAAIEKLVKVAEKVVQKVAANSVANETLEAEVENAVESEEGTHTALQEESSSVQKHKKKLLKVQSDEEPQQVAVQLPEERTKTRGSLLEAFRQVEHPDEKAKVN